MIRSSNHVLRTKIIQNEKKQTTFIYTRTMRKHVLFSTWRTNLFSTNANIINAFDKSIQLSKSLIRNKKCQLLDNWFTMEWNEVDLKFSNFKFFEMDENVYFFQGKIHSS